MGSSSGSGTSSGSFLLRNSGSEESLQQLVDERKRKRMLSNRESARRSRMRKQKHLNDLTTDLTRLRKENNQLITSVSITTQRYLTVESENSVLRAQVEELSHRLDSLNEIVASMNGGGDGFGNSGYPFNDVSADLFFNNPLSYVFANQPLMAAADMLLY